MTAPQLAERCRHALEACTWIVADPCRYALTRPEARKALRAALDEAASCAAWLDRLAERLEAEIADLEYAELAEYTQTPPASDELADVYALYTSLASRRESIYPTLHRSNGNAE